MHILYQTKGFQRITESLFRVHRIFSHGNHVKSALLVLY